MQVWFESIRPESSTLEYELVLPDGWEAQPGKGSMTAAGGGKKEIVDFVLTVPSNQATTYRRQTIALDATIDGVYRGQLAEAVVDMRPELDWDTGGEQRRRSAADA